MQYNYSMLEKEQYKEIKKGSKMTASYHDIHAHADVLTGH